MISKEIQSSFKGHVTIPAWNNTGLSITSNTDCWNIRGKKFKLNGLISGVVVNGKFERLPLSSSNIRDLVFENKLFKMKLSFDWDKYTEIHCKITNLTSEPVFIQKVVIASLNPDDSKSTLCLGSEPSDYRVLLNGFDSWGKTGSRPWIKSLGSKLDGDRLHDDSYFLTAIWSKKTRSVFTIGTAGITNYPSVFSWTDLDGENRPSFSASKELNIAVEPSQIVELGGFALSESSDLTAALDNYASHYFEPVKTSSEAFYGWSTWDYYLSFPTMADVKENVTFIKKSPLLKDRIRIISIDDGWSKVAGDWRANIDFESSRAICAQWIINEGFIPGIWTMPLLVKPLAKLAVKHPDWFIKDSGGKHQNMNIGEPLFVDPVYCLDFTIPAVQDYIYNLYKTMHDEGFRYFKIDFLRTCCQQPQVPLSNYTVTRSEMVRNCLEIIRKAIGPESTICACGAPFEIVQGIANTIRTCDDVKNYWSNIQRSARSVAYCFWTQKNLWYADPDFCIVRGKDTDGLSQDYFPVEIPPEHIPFRWISGQPCTLNEAQVWATVQIISGGPVIFSDRLSTLNACGIDMLRQVLDNHKIRKFVPLDLMDSPMPAVWARCANNSSVKDKDYDLIAVFNWWEEDQKLNIDHLLNDHKWMDIWNKVLVTEHLEINARGVRLLKRIS